jgi:hypothetical protein
LISWLGRLIESRFLFLWVLFIRSLCWQHRQEGQVLEEAGQRGGGGHHVHQRAQSGVQQEDCAVLRQVHCGDPGELRAGDCAVKDIVVSVDQF